MVGGLSQALHNLGKSSWSAHILLVSSDPNRQPGDPTKVLRILLNEAYLLNVIEDFVARFCSFSRSPDNTSEHTLGVEYPPFQTPHQSQEGTLVIQRKVFQFCTMKSQNQTLHSFLSF